jgi:hypothetical protein
MNEAAMHRGAETSILTHIILVFLGYSESSGSAPQRPNVRKSLEHCHVSVHASIRCSHEHGLDQRGAVRIACQHMVHLQECVLSTACPGLLASGRLREGIAHRCGCELHEVAQ